MAGIFDNLEIPVPNNSVGEAFLQQGNRNADSDDVEEIVYAEYLHVLAMARVHTELLAFSGLGSRPSRPGDADAVSVGDSTLLLGGDASDADDERADDETVDTDSRALVLYEGDLHLYGARVCYTCYDPKAGPHPHQEFFVQMTHGLMWEPIHRELLGTLSRSHANLGYYGYAPDFDRKSIVPYEYDFIFPDRYSRHYENVPWFFYSLWEWVEWGDTWVYLNTQIMTILLGMFVSILGSFLPTMTFLPWSNQFMVYGDALVVFCSGFAGYMYRAFQPADHYEPPYSRLSHAIHSWLFAFYNVVFWVNVMNGLIYWPVFIQIVTSWIYMNVHTVFFVEYWHRFRRFFRRLGHSVLRIANYAHYHLFRKRVLDSNPQSVFIKDLTRECVEPNPGEDFLDFAHPLQVQTAVCIFQCIHSPDVPTFIAQFGSLFWAFHRTGIPLPYTVLPDDYVVDDNLSTVAGEHDGDAPDGGRFSSVGSKIFQDRRVLKFLKLLDGFCSLNGIKNHFKYVGHGSFIVDLSKWVYETFIACKAWYETGTYTPDFPLGALELELSSIENCLAQPDFRHDPSSSTNIWAINVRLGELRRSYLKTSTKEGPSYRVVLQDIDRRITIADERLITLLAPRKRVPPVGLMMCGPPAVGKSFMVEFMFKTIISAMSLEYYEDQYIKLKFDANGRADNLFPHHTCIDVGDIGQNSPNRQIPEWSPLQDICDSAPYLVQKANLADKGRCYITPLAVIGTSNTVGVMSGTTVDTLYHEMAVPNAIKRRFIWVRYCPKKDFNPLHLTDMYKYGNSDEFIEYTIFRHTPQVGYTDLQDGNFYRIVTWVELVAHIVTETKAHVARAKAFAEFAKETCQRCAAVPAHCKCPPVHTPVQVFRDVSQTLLPVIATGKDAAVRARQAFDALGRTVKAATHTASGEVEVATGIACAGILVAGGLAYSGFPFVEYTRYVRQPTTTNRRIFQFAIVKWRYPGLFDPIRWAAVFTFIGAAMALRSSKMPTPGLPLSTAGGAITRVWAKPTNPSNVAWHNFLTQKSRTRSVQDLFKVVKECVATLEFGSRFGVGILLPPYVLVNAHTISPGSTSFRVVHGGNQWGKLAKNFAVNGDLVAYHPSKDLAIIHLPGVIASVHLWLNWFPGSDAYQGPVLNAWTYVYHEEGESELIQLPPTVMATAVHCATSIPFPAIVGYSVVPGESGSPLFVADPGGRQHACLAGIAVQTTLGEGISHYVVVLPSDIERLIAPFRRGVGPVMEPFIPTGIPDPYSPAMMHDTPQIPLGSTGYRSNYRQTAVVSPLAEYFPDVDVGVPRNMDSYFSDFWHSPTHDAMALYKNTSVIDPYIVEQHIGAYVGGLMAHGGLKFFKDFNWAGLEGAQGEHLALNGNREYGIRRVNGTSSAGPPTGGTREMRYERVPDGSTDYHYILQPRVRQDFNAYMDALSSDGIASVWMNAFPKTGECGAVGKTVRIVYGIGDIPYLAARLLLAPIVAFMHANPKLCGCGVGWVSTDYKQVEQLVNTFSGGVIDTDFKAWDKRLLAIVPRALLQAFADCLPCPSWYKIALRNFAEDIAYPFVKWNSDWVLHTMGWGSGVAYTSELNSMFLNFTYYYCFARAGSAQSFWIVPKIAYGDDGLLGRTTHVTMSDLKEYTSELNQVLTSGIDKGGELAWATIDDAAFLKRRFVKRGEFWYAPLALSSVYRPTKFYEPNGGPPSAQLSSILDSVLLEAYLHGPDEFDRAYSSAMAANSALMIGATLRTYDWYEEWYKSDQDKLIWSMPGGA